MSQAALSGNLTKESGFGCPGEHYLLEFTVPVVEDG